MTAVDRNDTLEMLHSICADMVIDYTEEDFTQRGEPYDLIVDIPGNHPFSACRWALTPQGKYVLVGHDNDDPNARRRLGSTPCFAGLVVRSPFNRNLPALGFSLPSRQDSLTELGALLAAG